MSRYRLFKRNGVYYSEDVESGKQKSLRTTNHEEASRLVFHRQEAGRMPALNREIARTYLSAGDPELTKRTWQMVMDTLQSSGSSSTRERARWAAKCKDFDSIRHKPLVETTSDDFLKVLMDGKTSTNHFLRRYHNMALGLGWLPWPVLPKKLWPPIRHARKRAIKWEEHQKIVKREGNQERRLFYELLWETGASQSDAARLTHESINWREKLLTIHRRKIEHHDPIPAQIRIGERLEGILRQLPQEGPLFPYLRNVDCKHRGTEFHQRCEGLGIHGISLHSYRYAWAVRARQCGYPERFAQAVLGHASKAVHRAYARSAEMTVPALEMYEKQYAAMNVVPVNFFQIQQSIEKKNQSSGH